MTFPTREFAPARLVAAEFNEELIAIWFIRPLRSYHPLAMKFAVRRGLRQPGHPGSKDWDTMSKLRRLFVPCSRSAMAARPKALIAWSSGKDSAWSLYEARRAGEYDIVGALDHGDRCLRARQHAWRARGDSAGATRSGGTAVDCRAYSLSMPERNLRGAHGRGAGGGQSRAASAPSSSAICFWRISAPIGWRSSPALASSRCFRCGNGRPLNWRGT